MGAGAVTAEPTDSAGVVPIADQRRNLGQSIWLFLLLTQWKSETDPYVRSGASIRAEELAAATGVGERQARRDLQRLRKAGHVELQNTGRGFKIRIYGSPLGTQSRA